MNYPLDDNKPVESEDDNLCPICLDDMTDETQTLLMPDCQHRLHVRCALSAMHYDGRCPICRNDTVVLPRTVPMGNDIFTQFEMELAEREAIHRRYQNRRSRIIRRRNSLKKLRDQLKTEKQLFCLAEKELDRTWTMMQRDMWTTNPKLLTLKLQRRKHQRRVCDLKRRLRGRLDPMIGPPPDEDDS